MTKAVNQGAPHYLISLLVTTINSVGQHTPTQTFLYLIWFHYLSDKQQGDHILPHCNLRSIHYALLGLAVLVANNGRKTPALRLQGNALNVISLLT